ncbi:AAA family ATPase [Planctomycetota bacterium]|nr:AAA family ATPase [Planctomycetota bacterium]
MTERLKNELDNIWAKLQQAGVGTGDHNDPNQRLGVLVPIGMIGSGKTTVAKYFLEKGWLMAYEDLLIRSFHGGEYDYLNSLKYHYLNIMADVAAYWIGQGYSAITDSTNHTKERRKNVIERLAQVRGRDSIYVIGIEMPKMDAAFHANMRIGTNTRGYAVERWKNVAAEHDAEYEALTDDEGFDLVVHLPNVFS